MASTRDLHPAFRDMAHELYEVAKELDPTFVITSAKRSFLDQLRLWKRYSEGESDLPAARPGTSKHELGLAIDIARLNVHPREDELLAALGEAWREDGGVWGGEVDPVHFEAPRDLLGRLMEGEATALVEREERKTAFVGRAIDWLTDLF